MKDNNRLTEKIMVQIAENLIEAKLKPLREIIDDYLEKAWHEGYDSGLEDCDCTVGTVVDEQTKEPK